jgi:acetolactate synthase-1/2/3 large subunit
MKLSDYVIHKIAEQGVKHIFLLPGGGCMHLLDSVGRSTELEFVCNLHEQAVAIAAEAYGQYTNNLGAALVTTGPGGTNTITGVAAAWLESTPTIFISGQVKTADLIGERGVRQMGFQEINIIDIVKPITKYAVTITDPLTIKYHLEKALYLAKSGRPGPVWLDIPLDIQAADINELQLASFNLSEIKININSDLSNKVSKCIDLLNESVRPVILVGNGVRLANAKKELFELLDFIGIPVLPTWRVIDFFPHEYPLYIGRPGAIAHRAANFAQQNSDLFISIGARLDMGQTAYNHKNFARTAKKIIVDIDPNEINKLDMTIDVPVTADAKEFLKEFLYQKNKIISKDRRMWLGKCQEWKNKYPVELPIYWDDKDGVNNYVLIETLSELLNKDNIVIPGSSGACSEVTMQALKIKEGMRVFNCNNLGPMGFTIPASIGGCLASNRKRTICIDGDGGFHMNSQELETIKRLNLPIKIFVLDNEGYASIRATQKNYFNGFYVASNASSGLTLPSIEKIAAAYSIPYYRIAETNGIKQRVSEILNVEGPAICAVKVSPTQYTAPRVSSRQNPDGSMVSLPMEDLWPFLDREEFNKNMMAKNTKEAE